MHFNGTHINCILKIFLSLATISSVKIITKYNEENSSALIIFFIQMFLVYIQYTIILLMLTFKCPALYNTIQCYASNLYVSTIHNTGSVLKLQLIVETTAFLELYVVLVETLKTYKHYDFES